MPDYTLIRSRRRRKTITMQVQGNGEVVIRAPWFTSRREADTFFSSKGPWLKAQFSLQRRNASEFQTDGRILYGGTIYPLEVRPQEGGPESVILRDHRFFLRCDNEWRMRAIMTTWLAEQAKEHFKERIAHYEEVTGHRPAGFRLSNAKCRWGSCSPQNRLFLNWRLIMAPRAVLDYVVVHELMHIAEKNHSPRFWELVTRIISDHKVQRRWLRENAFLLTV